MDVIIVNIILYIFIAMIIIGSLVYAWELIIICLILGIIFLILKKLGIIVIILIILLIFICKKIINIRRGTP